MSQSFLLAENVLPCGYSYWNNINAHGQLPHLLVFLGTPQGPSLWQVDKSSLAVSSLGPLFPDHPLKWSTGEGWYWSATDPYLLFATDHEHLYKVDVRSKAVIPVVDITPFHHFGCILWQFHSSHDGTVHSATVKLIADNYRPIGTIVYREGVSEPWSWFPMKGTLDESQIDKSGRWLVIKEQLDDYAGEDNRIIDLYTGVERQLLDQHGAAGHSDLGFGYMVAADNWHQAPAAWRLWMLDGSEPQGRLIYHAPSWPVQITHIGHGNAQPGSPDGQWVVGSGLGGEILQIPLSGGLARAIAPDHLAGHDYANLAKANVDPSGEFVLWTTGGQAFLAKV